MAPSPTPVGSRPSRGPGVRLLATACLAFIACRVLAAVAAGAGPVHPSALFGLAPERFTFRTGCIEVIDGPCPAGDEDGIEARTVAWMDAARHSLHAALYELSLPAVTSALIAAHQRGVDVRVHSETDSRTSSNQARNFAMLTAAGIPLTFDERPSLMHDKFIVRDGTAVWTGSANLTWPGVHLHYNEAVIVDEPRVAALYETEFERLQGHREPDTEGDGVHEVEARGMRIRVAFAPRGARETLFMDAIHAARREIRVAAFSLTHRGLVAALSERAAAGVSVEVILDGRNARARPAQEAARCLQNAGCRVSSALQRPHPDIVARFGLPASQDIKIHHKLLLVDERVVVTGSANLSANGLDRNDENVLLLESAELGGKYRWVLDRARASCRREDP